MLSCLGKAVSLAKTTNVATVERCLFGFRNNSLVGFRSCCGHVPELKFALQGRSGAGHGESLRSADGEALRIGARNWRT